MVNNTKREVLKMVKTVLKKIDEFNQRRWLLFSFITTTSGIWFSLILSFFGEALHFIVVNETGGRRFTVLGFSLTFITVGWSLLSLIAQKYCEFSNKQGSITVEEVGETETIYETLNGSTTNILETSLFEKLKTIEAIHNNEAIIERLTDKPCVTLQKISSEMVKVLSKLLSYKKHNIREKDLYVSIYYNFPLEDETKWYRADNAKHKRGLKTEDLFSKNTTFFELINSSEKNYVFYSSKQTAKEQGHYLPDPEDIIKKGKIEGSIACYKYDISNEDTYVKFVISISSYGKSFSATDDEESINNISYNFKHNIMSEYEMILKSTLCDLYISHISSQKNDDKLKEKCKNN